MARHQASMSQQNKMVYVLECPADEDDNIPLPQLISQLENNGMLLRPLLHKKGKTVLPVIWKIDSDVPDHFLGDTMRLTQIMLNLCSNAVKVKSIINNHHVINILTQKKKSSQSKVVFTFILNDPHRHPE